MRIARASAARSSPLRCGALLVAAWRGGGVAGSPVRSATGDAADEAAGRPTLTFWVGFSARELG